MATYKELSLRMIPILVRWAQSTWDKPHYYSDLSYAIGYGSDQIGPILKILDDTIKALPVPKGKAKPPTLNALVKNIKSGLPSDGFDEIIPGYSELSPESKRGEVYNLNKNAHLYDWSWVLKALHLKPNRILQEKDIKKLRKGVFGVGGEGKEHNSLKKYIANHPDKVGINRVKRTIIEQVLLSGDKLDVYFECGRNKHFAIEVKPSYSQFDDILRGVFQCVKYKSVMDAMRVVDNDSYDNYTLLVIACKMPEPISLLAKELGVSYIDNFKAHVK